LEVEVGFVFGVHLRDSGSGDVEARGDLSLGDFLLEKLEHHDAFAKGSHFLTVEEFVEEGFELAWRAAGESEESLMLDRLLQVGISLVFGEGGHGCF